MQANQTKQHNFLDSLTQAPTQIRTHAETVVQDHAQLLVNTTCNRLFNLMMNVMILIHISVCTPSLDMAISQELVYMRLQQCVGWVYGFANMSLCLWCLHLPEMLVLI